MLMLSPIATEVVFTVLGFFFFLPFQTFLLCYILDMSPYSALALEVKRLVLDSVHLQFSKVASSVSTLPQCSKCTICFLTT